MWRRLAEVAGGPRPVLIRDEAATGPECRMCAALLHWDRHNGVQGPATIVGVAYKDLTGAVAWGWPDEDGQVRLLPGAGTPASCTLLPPALSLALAFKNGGFEPGARILVIGDGLLGRVARAVALSLGGRIRVWTGPDGPGITRETFPAEILVETTGLAENLDFALEQCRDWGSVYSLAGALTCAPHDLYTHVHRRALRLTQVPFRPGSSEGDVTRLTSGATVLAQGLVGITPEPHETLEAQVIPGTVSARLVRDRDGWGLVLTAADR